MTDPIVTDADKAMADIKAETSKLDTTVKADEVKIESFWARNKIYVALAGGLIAGGALGHWVF